MNNESYYYANFQSDYFLPTENTSKNVFLNDYQPDVFFSPIEEFEVDCTPYINIIMEKYDEAWRELAKH